MNDKERNEIALFRYGIIAPAVTGIYDDSISLKGFFRDAATKTYTNPRGESTKISASTIERWFRNMKDLWMSQLNMNEFSSINELASSLFKFVNNYNKTIHSSLNGKTPEDRFYEEGCLIKRLSDETIDTSFLLE